MWQKPNIVIPTSSFPSSREPSPTLEKQHQLSPISRFHHSPSVSPRSPPSPITKDRLEEFESSRKFQIIPQSIRPSLGTSSLCACCPPHPHSRITQLCKLCEPGPREGEAAPFGSPRETSQYCSRHIYGNERSRIFSMNSSISSRPRPQFSSLYGEKKNVLKSKIFLCNL